MTKAAEQLQHAQSAPSAPQLQQWVAAAQDALQWPGARRVGIALLDAAEMAALNAKFRGKPAPTNVLSFPAPTALPAGEDANLGDIALCGEIIAEESRQQRLDTLAHWAHMVVHATLHLMGYDHLTPEQAGQMEGLESTILCRLEMADPWAEEVAATAPSSAVKSV